MKEHHNTIIVEQAHVLTNSRFEGDQCIMRLHAPRIAKKSLPGQFIHMRCGNDLAMRRPMSIMHADPTTGWVDILFKIHGLGTALLADAGEDTVFSVMGPIGNPFRLSDYKPHALLIGGGVGIPPMIFLAEHLRRFDVNVLVLMGSEVPFPFQSRPSQIMVPGLPNDVIAAMPLLEDWGVPSRLSSLNDYPGCYQGYVTELAQHWYEHAEVSSSDIEVFSCGPTPMLRAVQHFAGKHQLANQLSLEEYMACAVGGCAGCTVLTDSVEGRQMKRVCVDGPIFDGDIVVFN